MPARIYLRIRRLLYMLYMLIRVKAQILYESIQVESEPSSHVRYRWVF